MVCEQAVQQVEDERGEGPRERHRASHAFVQGLHEQVRRSRHLRADALDNPKLVQLQRRLPELCEDRQRQAHAGRRRRNEHQGHRICPVQRLW